MRVGPSTTRYSNRTGVRVNSAARAEAYELLDSVISRANARQEEAEKVASR